MIALNVNIDHIATVRQARRGSEPDPVTAALMAELAGANGITAHLREDRRHIQERDIRLLRQMVQTLLNLEMAPTAAMFELALEVKPDLVTLVPEKREEVTTEGGLDVIRTGPNIKSELARLRASGIRVSLFIEANPKQIQASADCGADEIELHTGAYALAKSSEERLALWHQLREGAIQAHGLGLRVNAGHGLNYQNIHAICELPHLRELNIGHSLISRATFVGLPQAVQEMLALIHQK